MAKYIVQNKDNNFFFEQDFAGWSWQEDKKQAYKFSSKNDATCAVDLLVAMGYNVFIEEVKK